MSTPHPTPAVEADKPSKPTKPYDEFPLFAHASGQWAKKIRGKMYYFGQWTAPDAALEKYLNDKDALHAGRKPREDTTGTTIKDAANAFLNHKRQLLEAGEITNRTWTEYEASCQLLVKELGKSRLVDDVGPDDFASLRCKMAKTWGPVTLGNAIQRIRSVFKYAMDSGLTEKPIRYGREFKRPSKKTIRIDKAKRGIKLFTADEIRRMLDAAPCHLRAMIYLGINCGYGNADCGTLPQSALDLDGRVVTFPRPKTGINRRSALWPETIAAIKEVLAERPAPKDAAWKELVFITKYGGPWHKTTRDTPISNEMRKLLNALGINDHRNFYTLRHTFRTVADESKDQPAIDHIMGHESPHMSTVYREHISDERLRAVTDHVRKWLFPA